MKFKEIDYVVSILGKTPLKLLLAVRDIKMDQGQSQWAKLVPGGVELASIYHFMHSLSEFWDIAEVLRENWENWTLKKSMSQGFFWDFLDWGSKCTSLGSF